MRSPVPGFVRSLEAIENILRKGEDFSAAHELDPAELLEARMAPTMKPLTHQIRLCCNYAAAAATLLSDSDAVTVDGAYDSFADLYARLAEAREIVAGVPAGAFANADSLVVPVTLDEHPVPYAAHDYLMEYAMPNFYFSMTTAYNLLRQKGVPLGKKDFLGV